jgi:hypothetical protein
VISMVAAAKNLTTLLAAAVAGPGEMGMLSTLHDIELLNRGGSATDRSHGQNLLNSSTSAELASWLGSPLPASCKPNMTYTGPARLIARAVQSSVDEGEAVPVSVVVLASDIPETVQLFYRPMGASNAMWHVVDMARSGSVGLVYAAAFVASSSDSEYYIEAHVGRHTLRWPECASDVIPSPCATQTVIMV